MTDRSENLSKTYRPADLERSIYERWESSDWFRPSGEGESYCIMIPPPNVTGTLHMGHAFQDTIMDALTRYHRMDGHCTLWQPGTDHAGIATQMVVERQLEAEGLTRHDLGREKFVARVWDWKAQSGNRITEQMRRMGASVDWSRERFTMDEDLSRAVVEVFVRMYDEGLIYRGKRLVNWDPVLHTAVSDLEVLSEEESGHLWHFRYPLEDDDGYLTVATTRPETMLGDTAVAVHPDDERYSALVGKFVELPLTGRRIPVVADEYVDPEFGTGCVKITPAHDFNDYEVGRRHDLELLNIFDASARVNDNAPEAYRGLDRLEARERVLADLDALGLLAGTDDHRLMVPRGDRSGAVIEPWLTDQWYVRTEPLARPAIDAVESGHIRFVPENWAKTYFEWMYNIQDWCISRQLWWGHRIPAWYDPDGGIHVGRDEPEARSRSGLADDVPLRQDDDVLDTWFSSALWPFSTLGWPDRTDALERFYPTDVLVTGFDIIFFWVARMIMMGLKFAGDVPFRHVYITGLVKDEDGFKMSKSRGNVLDPIDLIDGIDLESLVTKRTTGLMQTHLAPRIEKATRRQFPDGIPEFGVDAVRFTFAALASTSRDIRFDLARVEGYRNFCNKIWNAARYVLMSVGDSTAPATSGEHGLADRWIRSRLGETIRDVRRHLETYRFDLAAQALHEFTWHEFCDWYLELSKPVLRGEDAERAAATRETLIEVLEALMRALHPIMPFITEAIWLELRPLTARTEPSIMLAPYPENETFPADADAETEIEWVKGFLSGIRQIRGEMDIPPGRELPVILQDASEADRRRVEQHAARLENLGRLSSIVLLDDAEAPPAAIALLGRLRLLVPLAGVINVGAERQRLNKSLEKALTDQRRLAGKLTNEQFVSRAPTHVVEKEQKKLADVEQIISQLEEQLAALESIET